MNPSLPNINLFPMPPYTLAQSCEMTVQCIWVLVLCLWQMGVNSSKRDLYFRAFSEFLMFHFMSWEMFFFPTTHFSRPQKVGDRLPRHPPYESLSNLLTWPGFTCTFPLPFSLWINRLNLFCWTRFLLRNGIMPRKPLSQHSHETSPDLMEEFSCVVSAPKYFTKYQYLCDQNIKSPNF